MTRYWTIRGRRRHRHWIKQLWNNIDPNSAEGKAIARLEAMERGEVTEEDFITVIRGGVEVSEEEIERQLDESMKRIKERYGYDPV